MFFLRDTRVGCIGTKRRLPEEMIGDEEAGIVQGIMGERGGRALQLCNSPCSSLWGEGERVVLLGSIISIWDWEMVM